MSKLRVGIVGAGFMGKAHGECYEGNRDAEIAMVFSRSEEKARTVAETFGAQWTTDWRSLVNSDLVDAVDITVPNEIHCDVALQAISAGKPFLIEKPLARNVNEARKIVEAAKKSGVPGVYGENMRFSPAAIKTRDIIDQGGIGDVIMLRTNEIHNGPFHSDWFWDAEKTGGGAVIDMGIHGIYFLEWMVGSPVRRVYAEVDTLKWTEHCKNGAEDTAFAVLRFDNGAIAELVNSWAISGGIDVRAEIYGTEGTIHLDKSRGTGGMMAYSQKGYGKPLDVEASLRPHVSTTQGWHFPTPDEWGSHGHAQEVNHFVEVALGKAAPICTLDQGLRALEITDAIYRSAREGRPIIMSDGSGRLESAG